MIYIYKVLSTFAWHTEVLHTDITGAYYTEGTCHMSWGIPGKSDSDPFHAHEPTIPTKHSRLLQATPAPSSSEHISTPASVHDEALASSSDLETP